MYEVDARQIYEAVRERLAAMGADQRLLHVVSGDQCYPPAAPVLQIVDECRALGLDVLTRDGSGERLLVAGYAYDNVYAVSRIGASLPAAIAARDLQRLLAANPPGKPGPALLPASEVSAALGRWERQLALVYGRRFAARLVEKACGGSSAPLAPGGLEAVRRHLVAVTGGCIVFSSGRRK